MERPFRDELKFVITCDDHAYLRERWRRYLRPDPHTNADAVTPILSQYYDTPDLDFVRDKVDGLWFRNKVRVRTYGTRFRAGQAAFLEIKQRLGDQVRKVRQPLDYGGPHDLDPVAWRFSDAGAEAAFGALVQRLRLRATARVWYQREAHEGVVEPDVRVTFDTGLIALFPGEEMTLATATSRERALLPDRLTILEVKSNTGIPAWVTDGAFATELWQETVPKYVMAVEKLGLDRHSHMRIYA